MIQQLDNTNNKREGCIAAALPFPPLSWWKAALKHKKVLLDPHEHFQKMSYRNRYYLADKIGMSLMSIPLSKGRNQHLPMYEMKISYMEDWQKKHWRTLQTLLGNSPFFEYIDFQLFPFYKEKQTSLYQWNKESIIWANNFMGNPLEILETDKYIPHSDDPSTDIRNLIHPKNEIENGTEYYQVFKNKAGFLNDCSILDLICCEGKNALNILLT